MEIVLRVIIYLFFVLLPIGFWILFVRWQDKSSPEPKPLLVKLFLLGVVIAVVAIMVELMLMVPLLKGQDFQLMLSQAVSSSPEAVKVTRIAFVIAAVVEEIFKFMVLRFYVYAKKEFDQIKDGIFYGFTVSLGFILVENSLYFLGYGQEGIATLVLVTFTRGLLTAVLHITTAGIMGLALGRKKFSQEHKDAPVWASLFAAVLIHAVFNMATLKVYGLLFNFVLALAGLTFLIWQMNRSSSKVVWTLVGATKSKKDTSDVQ